MEAAIPELAVVLAIGLFAAAAVSDVARRRIPNWIVIALACLGLARILLSSSLAGLGVDLGMAVLVFALGAVMFRFGLFGGGDVKLLAAGALWLGAASVGAFVLATALAGGVLALAFLMPRLRGGGGAATTAAPVLPYGVAIAAGGILATLGLI